MTEPGRTCQFPGCAHPVAPPPPTGGRSSYCARPEHNRTTAYTERRRQAAQEAAGVLVEERSGERPASLATATLGEITARLGQTLERFAEQVAAASSALTLATDSETIELE